jgi:hypothetical protein
MLSLPLPPKKTKTKRGSRLTFLVRQFNALWLDPINRDTFPVGLWDAVASTTAAAVPAWHERSTEERLREQMQADALQPLDDDDDADADAAAAAERSPKNTDLNSEVHLPPKMIEQAAQFLRLNVSTRPSAADP